MKTPKTIERRIQLAKALKQTFDYDLKDSDKIRYSRPYCDRNIVDIEIENAEGLFAYVDAYDTKRGCFPYDTSDYEVC